MPSKFAFMNLINFFCLHLFHIMNPIKGKSVFIINLFVKNSTTIHKNIKYGSNWLYATDSIFKYCAIKIATSKKRKSTRSHKKAFLTQQEREKK